MRMIAVIPAHNEAQHIAAVVTAAIVRTDDVIVIDDCSRDDTAVLAAAAGARVYRHPLNLGKAGAIKTGCEAAIAAGADIVALLDGDGQHNPAHLSAFREAFDSDPDLDVVFGSRLDITTMPIIRRIGTKGLEHTMRALFSINTRDMQCGYRAFRTRVYPLLCWKSKNYHADAEITARVGKYRLRYREIPIETIYHDAEKGMTVVDGIGLLWKIFLWRFTL